ncbi:MAG TPA: rhodanese-like domain-containing protein [Bacteroidota bacterium]|jgi:rhodanese-related sulfurtransferase|nr:rhodanese-like domain-containing protein [Bacteroidota bacterium]
MREIAIILSLSIILALAYNAFSPKGLSLIRVEPLKQLVSDSTLFSPTGTDTSGTPAGPPDTAKWSSIKVIAPLHDRALRNPDSMKAVVKKGNEATVYRIISLDQLNRLLKARRGFLIDARNEEDYLKGHIKGAHNVYGQEPEKHVEHLVQIPRDTLVVIYCNNPECHLGRFLAEFMAVMEFKNMVLYDDGWDGWEKAKMPVDSTIVNF